MLKCDVWLSVDETGEDDDEVVRDDRDSVTLAIQSHILHQ